MKSARFFKDFKRRRMVVLCRRFGTSYRCNL